MNRRTFVISVPLICFSGCSQVRVPSVRHPPLARLRKWVDEYVDALTVGGQPKLAPLMEGSRDSPDKHYRRRGNRLWLIISTQEDGLIPERPVLIVQVENSANESEQQTWRLVFNWDESSQTLRFRGDSTL